MGTRTIADDNHLKPHLLLLPGMLNDARVWGPVIAALDGAAAVQVVDFGSSTTLAEMAEIAWDAVHAIAIEQPLVIAGFSMGGYVALEMMARARRRVDAVALLATSARADTPEGAASRAQAIESIERDFPHFVQSVARYSTHRRWHHDAATMGAVRSMLADCGAEMAIRQTRAVVRREDHRLRLADWRVPTLVMAGSEDRVVAPALTEEIATLIPGSLFERVPDCGHLLPLEQPRRVATALRALLEAATHTTKDSIMSLQQSDPIAVVRAILKAWDARDFVAVLALFSDDAVLHSMMIEPIVGRASIEARLARLKSAPHNAELKILRMGLIDGCVFAERLDVITLNGKSTGVPVVGVFEVDGGRVKAWREYYDRRQLLAAMGIVEDFDRTAR